MIQLVNAIKLRRGPLIRRQFHERWRPGKMPPDLAEWHSLIRIIDLYCASLSGQNPARPARVDLDT
jgi:hypothetical protein